MAAAKKTAKKAPAKKTAKKAAAKKSPAKKTAAKKSTAKKAPAKKAAKKAPAKKSSAKKSTAKKATASSSDKPMLISKSKIKEALKGHGKRTDSSLFDSLNDEIHAMLEKAANRAEGNKRGTVRPNDL